MSGQAVQLTRVEQEVFNLEIKEKGCLVCMRGVQFGDGYIACKTNLEFPKCRSNKKKGFKLNE